tara:strand:- start:351 stop:464 length:114 start_codon:yes stop_codon:yes gene_type:complete
MSQELWDKQAPSRVEKTAGAVDPAPVKKAGKKAAKKG